MSQFWYKIKVYKHFFDQSSIIQFYCDVFYILVRFSLSYDQIAVKLAEFDMGVDPQMSPAIGESFGKFKNSHNRKL